MKKTKPNQIQIGISILLLATTSAFSSEDGTTNQPAPQMTKPAAQIEKYRAQETSLDFFATGSINQETIDRLSGINYKDDVNYGVGVGLNHFFTRNIGIGVEAYSEDTERHFVDSTSANLIARFPLGESGFAPYLYIGGGRQFDPIELSFAQAGAGLEFRFTPNVGLFLDGRYVMTDGADNHGLARLGLRLAF
jgi:opacity protein-like surface antigen